MESMEEDGGCPYKENLNFCGHITTIAHIYKTSILVNIITKMPLQTKNVGPMTWTSSLTWHRRGNDVTTLSSS